MVNVTEFNRPPVTTTARCPHAPVVSVMVELEGPRGEHLQRFSCGKCVRGWWESDGALIDLDEAVGKMREVAHGLHSRRTSAKRRRPAAEPDVRPPAWSVERSEIERFTRVLSS